MCKERGLNTNKIKSNAHDRECTSTNAYWIGRRKMEQNGGKKYLGLIISSNGKIDAKIHSIQTSNLIYTKLIKP